MSTNYSPFADIFETKTHPHARTLRTSFSQKLTDAFDIIAGELLAETNHVGLFDYFTLFVPYLLIRANEWLEKSGYDTLSSVLFTINIVIFLPRILVAVIGTILCLPIIASVHGISKLIAGQAYSEALDIKGKKADEEDLVPLSNYLIKTKLTLEDLNSTCKYVDNNNYEIELKPRASRSYESFLIKITNNENEAVNKSTNIHAFFSLNIANATSELENTQDPSLNDNNKNFLLSI